MTYALSSAGLWVNRANQAWGSSRQYNVGSSFEQDSAANAANAATWQGRANQAWGSSRVWSSGSSFETDLAAMTTDRNTWQSRANQAWGPSRVWNSGNSFETNYNNLLAGLNNPEGLQSQGFSISHNAGGGDVSYGPFTFARTGHFHVAVLFPVHGPNITQGNAYSQLTLAGTAGITLSQNFNEGTNTGSTTRDWLHGGHWDVNVSAGQTITIVYNCFVTGNPTTGTLTVYAHFVPNATYHN